MNNKKYDYGIFWKSGRCLLYQYTKYESPMLSGS
jgi:hypothetical protein